MNYVLWRQLWKCLFGLRSLSNGFQNYYVMAYYFEYYTLRAVEEKQSDIFIKSTENTEHF